MTDVVALRSWEGMVGYERVCGAVGDVDVAGVTWRGRLLKTFFASALIRVRASTSRCFALADCDREDMYSD